MDTGNNSNGEGWLDRVTNNIALVTSISHHAKNFAMLLDESTQRLNDILDNMVAFNQETATKLSELGERRAAADLILEAVQDACMYIDSVDDFFYFSKETDFEVIKTDIRNGGNQKLNFFLHKMKQWIEKTKLPYKDYYDKCNRASEKFTELAELCTYNQKKAKANKKKIRIAGGTVSTVLFSSAIGVSTVAGCLTFGVGTVVGLGLTAAGLSVAGIGTSVVTHVSACDYGKNEADFKAASANLRNFAKHGAMLRRAFDELHTSLKRYENNCTFAENTDRSDQDTMCSTLDNMKRIHETQHFEFSKIREMLQRRKNAMIKQNMQWYG